MSLFFFFGGGGLYENGLEEQVEGTERRSTGTWASDSPDEI